LTQKEGRVSRPSFASPFDGVSGGPLLLYARLRWGVNHLADEELDMTLAVCGGLQC
jgi:hypothetical protein